MSSRQCGATLINGNHCKVKVANGKSGCIHHPNGVGPGDRARKVPVKNSSIDSSYIGVKSDFNYQLSGEIFDKYDVDPEDILPSDKDDYYAATEKKHFGDISGPGSQFTEVKSLIEFLDLAQEQKDKGLMDDDRQWYIDNGVNPESLRDGIRYIRVDTPGVVGSGDSTQLQDDDIVVPIRKSRSKGGDEYRFSFPVKEKPTVDHATLIIGDEVEEYGYDQDTVESLGIDTPPAVFFTCYPGSPGAFRGGVRDEKLEKLEERLANNPAPLTVAEVRKEYFDGVDFGVNYSTD